MTKKIFGLLINRKAAAFFVAERQPFKLGESVL
jgi:hypothetical protein